MLTRQCTCRHYRRNCTAKSYEHWNYASSGKSDLSKELVHEECNPRYVAAVLHEGEEERTASRLSAESLIRFRHPAKMPSITSPCSTSFTPAAVSALSVIARSVLTQCPAASRPLKACSDYVESEIKYRKHYQL